MSVSQITSWVLPGCGATCRPRQHDPMAHEATGFRLGILVTSRPGPRVVRTGPLVIDLDARGVTVDGEAVFLSGREWGLLSYLAEPIGRPRPYDDILRAMWGESWVTGRRRQRADGSYDRTDWQLVRIVASRLRAKLGVAGALVAPAPWPGGSPGLHLRRVEVSA